MVKASIFILDDDKDILTLFKRLLETNGYSVVTASSGREAMKIIEEKRFHVALLDIIIPDVRGYKIAKKLREVDKNIMIIILTGYSRFKDSVDARDLGIYKKLMKPISNNDLLKTVKSAVSAYKARARSHAFVRIVR